ncbi:MAG: uracil-DNA glycosylase [Actinobacteria bacterium]|nr:MAG: uracil-DNA glycosylase [Actinomycetota bacterium]
MAETLAELREEMIRKADCCALKPTRRHLVFGVGSETADLMFVGEAPGAKEDEMGEPFVGAAGKLLDRLLGRIGLRRDQVYIANVLKCRPPNNRDPLPEEVERCKPYLMEQVRIIKPKVVATLGNHATKLILDTNVGITKLHGKKVERPGYTVFPLYHPAAALYTPAYVEALEDDFDALKKALEEDDPPVAAAPEQTTLF